MKPYIHTIFLLMVFMCIGYADASQKRLADINAKVNKSNITRSVEVINVTPTLSSLSLESNATTVNVGETVQLSVEGTYSDSSTNIVDENVTYIITPVENAELNGSVVTALNDGNVTVQAKVGTTLSNAINLNITWTVNGHTLPPEPDKTLNDSTLLGIDTNDNGVRDDVERWIYKEYDHPIERGVFMQLSKALQYRIENPKEAWKYIYIEGKASECLIYWSDVKNKVNYIDINQRIQNIQFNTEARKESDTIYQKTLSGGVIEDNGLNANELIKQCDFSVEGL